MYTGLSAPPLLAERGGHGNGGGVVDPMSASMTLELTSGDESGADGADDDSADDDDARAAVAAARCARGGDGGGGGGGDGGGAPPMAFCATTFTGAPPPPPSSLCAARGDGDARRAIVTPSRSRDGHRDVIPPTVNRDVIFSP